MKNIKLFYITCANRSEAKKISHKLVIQKLAACVNLIGKINSIYFWKKKLQSDNEFLIVGKTTTNKMKKLISTVKNIHSYDVPCIVFFDIKKGNPEYLRWVKSSI